MDLETETHTLEIIAGLVPNHHNNVSIAVKQVIIWLVEDLAFN